MVIELTEAQKALLEEQLATGRYQSQAEVIVDALHLLRDHNQLQAIKLERLRSEIQKGVDSGPSTPLDMEDVKAEVRRRYNERRTQ